MWEFVESTKGIMDACNAITLKDHPDTPTPIIAGNVSFYNESKSGSIPPSPIVSCLGKLKNVKDSVSMNLQRPDSLLIMLGKRKDELGGSVFYSLQNELGANVPKPNLEECKKQIYAITDCAEKNLVLSCHDISDGGIATALTEMTFKNNIGIYVDIDSKMEPYKVLFSETGGFILEVEPSNKQDIVSIFNKYSLEFYHIGKTGGKNIRLNGQIELSIDRARQFWENGLRDKL